MCKLFRIFHAFHFSCRQKVRNRASIRDSHTSKFELSSSRNKAAAISGVHLKLETAKERETGTESENKKYNKKKLEIAN